MSYRGPDRRVHTIFVTHNREYHTRAGTCLAVRDRGSTAWMAAHAAVGLSVVRPGCGDPYVGRPLVLESRRTTVRTSRVVDVMRPGRKIVDAYSLALALRPCPAP